MHLKRFTHLILAVILFIPLHGYAKDSYKYRVVSVLDGDTFITTDGNIKFRVRIAAMDAPEKGQPYAKMAKYRLESMIKGKEVAIKPIGKGDDRYGRALGLVIFEGQDLAKEFIHEGLATYYRPSCKDYPADKNKYNYDPMPYIEAEKVARQSKKNMWSDEHAVLPCKYRRMK